LIQKLALSKLLLEQVKRFAEGQILDLDSMSELQPKGALKGYELSADDNGLFQKSKAVIISTRVFEAMFAAYMKDLWQLMLSLGRDGGLMFETPGNSLQTEQQSLTDTDRVLRDIA
jgi:hypothetical protein